MHSEIGIIIGCGPLCVMVCEVVEMAEIIKMIFIKPINI